MTNRSFEDRLMFTAGSHLSTTESVHWSAAECVMHDIINLVERGEITDSELDTLYRCGHLSRDIAEVMKERLGVKAAGGDNA